jgi:hypothetical protein
MTRNIGVSTVKKPGALLFGPGGIWTDGVIVMKGEILAVGDDGVVLPAKTGHFI